MCPNWGLLSFILIEFSRGFACTCWTFSLGIKTEARAFHMLNKPSVTEIHSQTSIYFLFWNRVSLNCPDWPWTHSVAQADLQLVILLPQAARVAGIIGLCHQAQPLYLLYKYFLFLILQKALFVKFNLQILLIYKSEINFLCQLMMEFVKHAFSSVSYYYAI